MQYFKPQGERFTGDCMPFFHDGTFRLYYLVDEGHHAGLGGVGGHQWAHSSTRDLIHWQHHPMALAITDPAEGSICTGSVFAHAGGYHAFYATRFLDWSEHLSHAVSPDAVRFEKTEPNPFASPPAGWSPRAFRDPCVFFSEDDGRFHMLVTARNDAPAVPGRGGLLAHLISHDLTAWSMAAPFLIPGLSGTPECPDYFFWNGWYYLVFSNEGIAHYRMSRQAFGPWLAPPVDTLDGPAARVTKTAAFTGGRRIGVAWLGTREGDTDGGRLQFGGHTLFREIVQRADGQLSSKFVPEMTPAGAPLPAAQAAPLTASTVFAADGLLRLADLTGLSAAALDGLPRDFRLHADVAAQSGAASFGLSLRASDSIESGYDLSFSPHSRIARLNEQQISAVDELAGPFSLEIVASGGIIDVCIGGARTLVDRCPEKRGGRLIAYTRNADVTFTNLELFTLQ